MLYFKCFPVFPVSMRFDLQMCLKNFITVLVFDFSASGYLHQMSTGHLILQKQNFVSTTKEFNHV